MADDAKDAKDAKGQRRSEGQSYKERVRTYETSPHHHHRDGGDRSGPPDWWSRFGRVPTHDRHGEGEQVTCCPRKGGRLLRRRLFGLEQGGHQDRRPVLLGRPDGLRRTVLRL